MKLISFGCTNYKPFNESININVRPLTLIFGRNSSGKSAALRLLRLILRAMDPRRRGHFPLDVDDISFGTTFSDLIHNRLPHGSATFTGEFFDDGNVLNISTTVQNIIVPGDEENMEFPVVSAFKIQSPIELNLDWEPSHSKIATYRGFGQIPFKGLLPSSQGNLTSEQWRTIFDWRDKIQNLESTISHIGPLRKSISRVYGNRPSEEFGIEGAGAPSRLAANSILFEKVAKWYQDNMDGWRLTIDKTGIASQYTLVRGNARVNLADAGQGMQQVLPIVVQQFSQQLAGGEFIHLIEQPELHLHTAAQAPLGDLFLETAKLGTGQVVIETHSENMLLRVRRRIAEGLDPRLVAIYWVEDHIEGNSTIRQINIDKFGNLDWWQEGVFSEGYEEVRAISRAAQAVKNRGQ